MRQNVKDSVKLRQNLKKVLKWDKMSMTVKMRKNVNDNFKMRQNVKES